jgi:hypothetical protein
MMHTSSHAAATSTRTPRVVDVAAAAHSSACSGRCRLCRRPWKDTTNCHCKKLIWRWTCLYKVQLSRVNGIEWVKNVKNVKNDESLATEHIRRYAFGIERIVCPSHIKFYIKKIVNRTFVTLLNRRLEFVQTTIKFYIKKIVNRTFVTLLNRRLEFVQTTSAGLSHQLPAPSLTSKGYFGPPLSPRRSY